MARTVRIPLERLAAYFDWFTRRFLRDGSPKAVDVEVLEPELGAQYAAQGARLLGISYDDRADSLEFMFDVGDHRVFEPQEVWVIERSDGFISVVEVVRPDGRCDVVRVQHVGLRRIE